MQSEPEMQLPSRKLDFQYFSAGTFWRYLHIYA